MRYVLVILLLLCCWSSPLVEAKQRKRIVDEYDVIIVGGGISGLTSAYRLRNHSKVLLLESEERVGGRAVSETYKGFTFAMGTEYLGKPQDYLKEMVEELGVEFVMVPQPEDIAFECGRLWYGWEGDAMRVAQRGSLEDYLWFWDRVLFVNDDYEHPPFLKHDSWIQYLDEVTALDWLDKMHVAPSIIESWNVSCRGLFGANLAEISALSLISEASFDFCRTDDDCLEKPKNVMELENSIARSKRYLASHYTTLTGITQLTDKLHQILQANIMLNSTVTRIRKNYDEDEEEEEEDEEDGGYIVEVVSSNDPSSVHRYAAEAVILAVPSPIVLEIAKSVLSKKQKHLLTQIYYSSYTTVALKGDDRIFDFGFDLAMPNSHVVSDFYDGTWVQRHYNQSLENSTASIVVAYVAPHSMFDFNPVALSDQSLLAAVLHDLNVVFPNASEKIKEASIHRFPYAYPVMTPGAYKRLAKMHKLQKNGLFLTGDFMSYPTFEAAVEHAAHTCDLLSKWWHQ